MRRGYVDSISSVAKGRISGALQGQNWIKRGKCGDGSRGVLFIQKAKVGPILQGYTPQAGALFQSVDHVT
jgi:hypothetical protein